MRDHPPRPVLALNLGVIGHRPNRLPGDALPKMEADIAAVLDGLRKAVAEVHVRHRAVFAADAPRLTLVSPLAEGADRMVADAAVERGYLLDALLPFLADEYEGDFASEESRAHFRGLVARARNVLELPGVREQRTEAYERLGSTMIGLCDMLIAVWDGGPPAGRGGTTAIIMASARAGLPLIHVDATGRQEPRILWSGFTQLPARAETVTDLPALPLADGLARIVDELIRPPSDAEERSRLDAYFAETAARRNLRIEFPLLLAGFGARRFRGTDFRPAGPDAKAMGFCKPAADVLTAAGMALPTELGRAYGWASAVGDRFAQVFRSAYVANFVLAALAVVTAVLSLHAADKTPFALFELVLMALVIANTQIGQRRNWHRRWIEAREIAERLRVTNCLWALADRPPVFHGEEPSWTGWYARALVRAQGMRRGRLDAEGLARSRDQLLGLLEEQCGYHAVNAGRMGKLAHRLERFGLVLFCLTFLVALDHSLGEPVIHFILERLPGHLDGGLVAVTLAAGLPALATASYGIRIIGDLEGIAERSERSREVLEHIKTAVAADPAELGLLRARARATVDAMLGDVANWRLAAESRGLALPG